MVDENLIISYVERHSENFGFYFFFKNFFSFKPIIFFTKSFEVWSTSMVQFSRSVVSDSLRPHESQHATPPCPSTTTTVQTHVHQVGDSIQPSHPLCPLLLLPPTPPSIRVFSNGSTLCMRWPKYWSFRFSISPSSEHPGLIFRMDWLDLLAVQGTLKSLPQYHNSKASILRHSAFFTVQLSHPHDHWKNHSLDYMDLCWESNVSAF